MDDQAIPEWAIRLRQARLDRLLSQKALARLMREAAGEDMPLAKTASLCRNIRYWEAGTYKPNALDRMLLCKALGTSEAELFCGQSPETAMPLPVRGSVARPAGEQYSDVLDHLRERDNLLGPRHTIPAVCEQIAILEQLLVPARRADRVEVLRLAARYAESAAWLYEDAGEVELGGRWADRAATWAYEVGDDHMIAWTMFRRSQQAMSGRRAGDVLGLAASALRQADRLPTPMRTAIVQQQAQGHALDGEERICQRLLDEAHALASAVNDDGDARGGHGSFCTPAYVEMQRARCWLELKQPQRAATMDEKAIPGLPPVYRRDRGMALAGLAAAYTGLGNPEQAAVQAVEALDIARAAGSVRIINMLTSVEQTLSIHRRLPSVAAFRLALTNARTN
ncbi:multiprotein-bridging factor 1 family protein [Nonomuraea angiospora]|uniref:Transcriptional regulator with XRE-family HTH domain n=1 Tax=Nonomuraea angiospora TaxID=46172 RepID=A0ABR9LV89_9ACTN|nr:helix-turn-helix transcriptional regulator [Nonomuraea angiospora]MBE1584573.1 transcriptional regulator with XRE-family HTH domain [Nonomuraea angiospora]